MSAINIHETLNVLTHHYAQIPKISEQKGQLVLQADATENEKIDSIIHFINNHINEINNNDLKYLIKIKENLSKKVNSLELKLKIDHAFQNFINQGSKNNSPSSNALPKKNKMVYQVKASPMKNEIFDETKLQENLKLFLEKFPRYQLGNDLEVFDKTYGKLPKETDIAAIRKQLQIFLKPNSGFTQTTKEICQSVAALLKPKDIIKFTLILQFSEKENKAMLKEAQASLSVNTPTVLTKVLLNCWTDKFTLLLQDKDLYVQKEGGLALIVSKGEDPASLGFSTDSKNSLIKWTDPIDKIPRKENEEETIAEDLKDVLANDHAEKDFYRLIALNGHGLTKKSIAGLSIKEFQKCLEVLSEKNLKFLTIGSCYSGGANSNAIHTPDNLIPCPIFLTSSFELVSYSSEGMPPLLVIENRLFTREPGMPLIERSLTQKDLDSIAAKAYSQEDREINNLGTVLLPTKAPEIPRVAYTKPYSPNRFLDIHQEMRKLHASPHVNEIVDDSKEGKAILFSDPIVPMKIVSSTTDSMPLLSRGGQSHHILKEYQAERQEIGEIILKTLNPGSKQEMQENSFKKTFAIGTMTCLHKGQLIVFENVLIHNTPKQRRLIFKIKGEKDFHFLRFPLSNLDLYSKPSSDRILPEEKIVKIIYQLLSSTSPSTETLLQATAGTKSEKMFYEALPEFFWNHQPPKIAQAFQSVLQIPSTISPKELKQFLTKHPNFSSLILTIAFQTHHIDLVKKLFDLNVKDAIGNTALHLAIIQKNEDLVKFFIHHKKTNFNLLNDKGKNPLYLAMKHNLSIPLILDLLNKAISKENINKKDSKDNPLLHYAIKFKKEKIVEYLLEKGADFNVKNANQKTPLGLALHYNLSEDLILKILKRDPGLIFSAYEECLSEEMSLKLIKLFIESNGNINLQDALGNTLLHNALILSEEEVVRYLLSQGANLDVANREGKTPIDHALELEVPPTQSIIDMLIKQKKENIDAYDSKACTWLYKAIFGTNDEIVRFLLENGVDINPPFGEGRAYSEKIVNFALKSWLTDATIIAIIDKHLENSDINDPKDRLLYCAVEAFNEGIAKYLLDKGADPRSEREKLLKLAKENKFSPEFLGELAAKLSDVKK